MTQIDSYKNGQIYYSSVDFSKSNEKIFNTSVNSNGKKLIIKGTVRDTCIENSEYKIHLKQYLGGGTYGMAFEGLYFNKNKWIKVAIKIYRDESDMEENIQNTVSELFPNNVATFYKGSKCKIYNSSEKKIPTTDYIRICVMEKGLAFDNYIRTKNISDDNFKELIKKTAENCSAFNKGGFLHNDIKPGNTIISDTRPELGGILIDFGMTALNHLPNFPPVDALYFLLTLYKFESMNKNIKEFVKILCRNYYDKILTDGVTYKQLITNNRKNISSLNYGEYAADGLCSYNIKIQLDELCPYRTLYEKQKQQEMYENQKQQEMYETQKQQDKVRQRPPRPVFTKMPDTHFQYW